VLERAPRTESWAIAPDTPSRGVNSTEKIYLEPRKPILSLILPSLQGLHIEKSLRALIHHIGHGGGRNNAHVGGNQTTIESANAFFLCDSPECVNHCLVDKWPAAGALQLEALTNHIQRMAGSLGKEEGKRKEDESVPSSEGGRSANVPEPAIPQTRPKAS